MKITAIMGMDVSKKTLDCHLFIQQKSLPPVSNDSKGFKTIKRWLLKELKTTEGLLVVMVITQGNSIHMSVKAKEAGITTSSNFTCDQQTFYFNTSIRHFRQSFAGYAVGTSLIFKLSPVPSPGVSTSFTGFPIIFPRALATSAFILFCNLLLESST